MASSTGSTKRCRRARHEPEPIREWLGLVTNDGLKQKTRPKFGDWLGTGELENPREAFDLVALPTVSNLAPGRWNEKLGVRGWSPYGRSGTDRSAISWGIVAHGKEAPRDQ